MKRKRSPKLTTAELLAAGHTGLADELRRRLVVSIATRRPRFRPPAGRGFVPTPETPTP